VQEVSTEVCREGLRWAGGDEESALMHPGGDCIGCHAEEGEGPRYVIAGTVYADAREPDDCFGVPGALVEITDASGSTWKLPTNDAGNFFLEQEDGPVVMPYTAVVTIGDMQRPMAAAQTTGACGSCHTVEGLNLAPGRIVTP
jgi:mono/diheme cytochrome c family protein